MNAPSVDFPKLIRKVSMRGIMPGLVLLSLLASNLSHSDEMEGKGHVLDFNSARAARVQKEGTSSTGPTESLAPEVKPLSGPNKVVPLQPKPKAVPVELNTDILATLNEMMQQAESLEKFTQREGFDSLTQNRVNILVHNIHTLEQNQFVVDSYRGGSPILEKLVDQVLAAQKRALDAIKSSKLYERLESEGFYIKLIPASLIKKPLPTNLLESMRAAALANQDYGSASYRQLAALSPGLTRAQERLRLPSQAIRSQLNFLSNSLEKNLQVMERARSFLSQKGKEHYDLENVDRLIQETRKSMNAEDTRLGLTLLKKSLKMSDRNLAASIESQMKRLDAVLGYIEMRGRFSTNHVENTPPTKSKSISSKFQDLLVAESSEAQSSAYSWILGSNGTLNDFSLEYVFARGAYEEGLSTDELLTIARRISDRMPASERHQLPEKLIKLYRKLNASGQGLLSQNGSRVAITKMAAVLHGLGDEASFHALEVLDADSALIADRKTIFLQEGKELRAYLKSLVTDIKTQHPEYKSSMSAAQRAGICVKNAILTILPL